LNGALPITRPPRGPDPRSGAILVLVPGLIDGTQPFGNESLIVTPLLAPALNVFAILLGGCPPPSRILHQKRINLGIPGFTEISTALGGSLTRELLAFVIPAISLGGAARVASILLSEWIDKGHEVHLLTFDGPDNLDAFPIDPRVIRHRLGNYKSPDDLMGFARTNVTRVRSVWHVLREVRPTAVVSFLLEANVIATLVGRSLGVPVLICERNHPGRHQIPAAKELIRAIVYPRATRLCVQTKDIRRWYADRFTCDVVVLPNPVAMDEVGSPRPSLAAEPGDRSKYAVTLARLARQKGLDRLITAFSRIAHRVPDWELIIFGEGDLRQELENQIAKLGVSERVRLRGATRAPRSELQRADLYVHPARYEGYPNAVLEALEAGLCVVATDCPGATREILQDGEFGILVPDDDIDALGEALAQAMSDGTLRMQYAAKARDAILGLEPAAIAQRWLEVIEACRPRGRGLN